MNLDAKSAWSMIRERVDGGRLLAWGGYCLYAVALAVALLCLYFPTDKLSARIQAEFDAVFPAHLVVDKTRLAFGPAIRLQGVAVRGEGDAGGLLYLEVDEVVLRPTWRTLLGGPPQLDYEITMGGGRVRGQIRAPRNGKGLNVWAALENIGVTRGTMLREVSGMEVSGTLDGKIEVRLKDGLAGSSGKADLAMVGGRLVPGHNGNFPFGSLGFRQLNLTADLAGRHLTMRQAELRGEVNNRLSGIIDLANPFCDSRLSLRGALGGPSGGKAAGHGGEPQGLSYLVTGTLKEPRFALGSGPKKEGPEVSPQPASGGESS
ncbi:MAG: type II secretion system protein GspN [Pseudomonadota bacterium]